ncbi:MAG: MerR family transcriptional regulator [Ruaniaceae bacterium]|nr:MerR family transcriptional regulator [Ruaniaceae bacterium]
MSQPELARTAEPTRAQDVSWPQDVSHTATMTIGAVISVLKAEFPAISISKVRFLEDQGLVTPQRTGSGYRKFSQADLARLRYALTQQRDHYLPLKVLKEQLDALDAGDEVLEHRAARMVTRDGALVSPSGGARINVRELAELTGTSSADVEELVRSGIIVQDRFGRFSAQCVGIVNAVQELARDGIDARHLRAMRSNADRVADLIEQVVAPMRAQSATVAKERASARASELSEASSRLYSHLVRAAIENEQV